MQDHKTIFDAVMRIFRSLILILLRHGVSYSAFSDMAKKAYVNVAMDDFTIENRKQTISRISILTGLHRKEVKAIQQAVTAGNDSSLEDKGNRAARVISGWRRDPQFLDEQGEPAGLPLKGAGATFETLVQRFSGNMPARAVLDELERVDAVSRTADGRLQLKARGYLPEGDEEMKLHILGTDVGALIATIEHNLKAEQGRAYFQRKVSYDNLPQEVLAKFRQVSSAQAQALLDELERYLARQHRDSNPASESTGRHTAGIGIYYFEKRR